MRPRPNTELLEQGDITAVAEGLWDWAMDSFLLPGSPLYNEEHEHLALASVGVLWTSVPWSRQQRTIVGYAEMPGQSQLSGWRKARAADQLTAWFGEVPDFLITLYAPWAGKVDDATFCALVEHEMYHCAQAINAFGSPRFTQDGRPIFAMRGHDAEEFVGIVRRYGAGAAAGGVAQLIQAAAAKPRIGVAELNHICGTCKAA